MTAFVRTETHQADRRGRAIDPARPEIEPAAIWSEPLDRLLFRLDTRPAGLGASDARSRLAIYGPNDAAAAKRSPPWLQFLARFRNPLVIIALRLRTVSV